MIKLTSIFASMRPGQDGTDRRHEPRHATAILLAYRHGLRCD
jgi:hypothetical protein